MAAGYPVKVNYLTGDVLTATNLNDLAGTVNLYDPTAKGDLFPATAADAVSRLAVGANDTVLTADSTAATGMKWAAAAGGGAFTEISSTALSGSSVVLSSIPQTYKHLVLVLKKFAPSGTADLLFKFNNTTASKGFVGNRGNNGTASTWIGTGTTAIELTINQGTATSDTENSCVMWIYNYTSTGGGRAFSVASGFVDNIPSNASLNLQGGFCGTSATALTSIGLNYAGGNHSQGTAVLFGVN